MRASPSGLYFRLLQICGVSTTQTGRIAFHAPSSCPAGITSSHDFFSASFFGSLCRGTFGYESAGTLLDAAPTRHLPSRRSSKSAALRLKLLRFFKSVLENLRTPCLREAKFETEHLIDEKTRQRRTTLPVGGQHHEEKKNAKNASNYPRRNRGARKFSIRLFRNIFFVVQN